MSNELMTKEQLSILDKIENWSEEEKEDFRKRVSEDFGEIVAAQKSFCQCCFCRNNRLIGNSIEVLG